MMAAASQRLMLLRLALLVMTVVAGSAFASPDPQPAQPNSDSPFARIADDIKKGSPSAPTTSQIILEDHEDYAKYVRWQREFSRQSWEWHLRSTKLLMYVVLAIVFFGLFITYLQFTQDRRPKRKKPAATAGAGPGSGQLESTEDPETSEEVADTPSKLKLGPEGLEITSQVIGLLVLCFSLAFFYLYVRNVYPIHEVDLKRQIESMPVAAPAPTASPAEKPE